MEAREVGSEHHETAQGRDPRKTPEEPDPRNQQRTRQRGHDRQSTYLRGDLVPRERELQREGSRQPSDVEPMRTGTDQAGLGAGRGKAAVVVVPTLAGSAPASSKTSWASPCHVVAPLAVPW